MGENDFHISLFPAYLVPLEASRADVAYNSTEHEYLVVYEGSNVVVGCGTGILLIRTIFARRVDAATGALIENNVVVSQNCDQLRDAQSPAVVYNATENEYLVVWEGDEDLNGHVSGELDIFGQLLSADLVEVGIETFRISDVGDPGDSLRDGTHPDVTYNSVENEYLVVWQGGDDVDGPLDFTTDVFGQRLNENGTAQGVNDFRISDMGSPGDSGFNGGPPAVSYNPVENEYLVVWTGSDDVDGQVSGEEEIHGQLLDANGTEQGVNDFRISDMGGTGNSTYKGLDPAVTHNSVDNEYLVVWHGDDDEGQLVDGEHEIFGQLLDVNGTELGVNDFRISDMGGTGDNPFDGFSPAVTYNPLENEYLVAWDGDDDVGDLIDFEFEIFGQRLDATGMEQGVNDFRISDMGGTGDESFDGLEPAVIYNPVENEYLVAWHGDDDEGVLLEGEFDIFGQRIGIPLFHDGFESGDTAAWSN